MIYSLLTLLILSFALLRSFHFISSHAETTSISLNVLCLSTQAELFFFFFPWNALGLISGSEMFIPLEKRLVRTRQGLRWRGSGVSGEALTQELRQRGGGWNPSYQS